MLKLILALSFFHISALSAEIRPPLVKPPQHSMPINFPEYKDPLDENDDPFDYLVMPTLTSPDDPNINNAMLKALKILIERDDFVPEEDRIGRLTRENQIFREDFITTYPKMSFENYFLWLVKETKIEQPVFIMSMILLDRFIKATKIAMDSDVAHKLFLVSLHMAQKYQCDKPLTNKIMARVSGVSEKYLREIEIKYFKALGWNLVVHKSEFDRYKMKFERFVHRMSSGRNTFESKN